MESLCVSVCTDGDAPDTHSYGGYLISSTFRWTWIVRSSFSAPDNRLKAIAYRFIQRFCGTPVFWLILVHDNEAFGVVVRKLTIHRSFIICIARFYTDNIGLARSFPVNEDTCLWTAPGGKLPTARPTAEFSGCSARKQDPGIFCSRGLLLWQEAS